MSFLLVLILLVLLGGVILYNRLVLSRNRVLAAWSDINVQLKRRHDLIPELVDAVRQYARYEQATLENVVALRRASESADGVGQIGPLEADLGRQVHRLLALAEQYPDLKANRSFLELQRDITAVENDIQYARRFYNGAVKRLNVQIGSFPDMLVARLFRFRPADYFEIEDHATAAGKL
ncbi:MAG TPA: LemA family protein [Chromatiales bacterium]|nr:LemA family protein [Chromatiales bacterium]